MYKSLFVAIAALVLSAGPSAAQDAGQQAVGNFFNTLNLMIQQQMAKDAANKQNQLTHEQVIVMQQLLLKRGFDVGEPDGVLGPKTMAVVAQLQFKAGLPATGIPDQQLYQALLQAQ